ncbi:MAG: ROK family protein [Luteolibacter sp.]
MKSDTPWLLGLDLGGTRLKALAITPDGREISRTSVPTGGDDWKNHVKQSVDDLLEKHGEPTTIGVAAPGLPAKDQCSTAHMPGRLPGLEGLDWQAFLGFHKPVPVLNDAHAALLGEVWLGSAKGLQNVILLTLGTGVGGAILSDGRLLRGHLGRAGHLGHISIRSDGPPDIVNTPGSLEDAVGNHTLHTRSDGKFHSTAELVAAANCGDPTAAAVWQATIRDLAAGVTSLINILDPEAIVIGGGIAEAGDTLFQPLAAELDRFEWRPLGHRVPILRAQLADWAGATGAAKYPNSKP